MGILDNKEVDRVALSREGHVHIQEEVDDNNMGGEEAKVDPETCTSATSNEQYKRVAYALRNARRQDAVQRGDGGSGSCIDDDWWLTFEVLVFQFVEMFSSYVVDPANAVRTTIEGRSNPSKLLRLKQSSLLQMPLITVSCCSCRIEPVSVEIV